LTRRLVVACVLCAACAKSPVAPNGTITVSAPAPLSPANGISVAVATQPVTLTIANAASTAGDFVTYTFEVATDTGFSSTVASKSAVQTPAQTALTLDVLPPAKYFWRARAIVGDTTGPFMSAATFTIVPASTPTSGTIQAPTPVLPVNASTVVGRRPTLTVVNASRSGVGAIGYWFEVATDAGFTNLVATGGAAEGATRTSFTPASNLSFTTTYFWRVRAFEISSGLSGSSSTTWTFVTGKAP
jgi:hypothetical protein